ncbi:MAG: hypothetical protein R2688_10145 [Fimbriimonadaceae bacterium]
MSVIQPTEMTHEQKLMSMRANNIHFSRAVTHHELIPGHHLQFFLLSGSTLIARESRTPHSGLKAGPLLGVLAL